MMSPVQTHTSATSNNPTATTTAAAAAAAAAIPVSSCSPLSIASSSGASSSSSSLSSSSPSSLAGAARSSPSASLSSHQHQLHFDLAGATSGADATNRAPPPHQPVIFSPVPRLATAATPAIGSEQQQQEQHQQYYNYYGHIRAVAAAAVAVAAHQQQQQQQQQQQRYDHPIDLSRPERVALLSPVTSTDERQRQDRFDHSIVSDHEEEVVDYNDADDDDDDGEEEEISVDEPPCPPVKQTAELLHPGSDCIEQAWDLSCRRGADGGGSERKRSSSEMSGSVTAPEPSRPPKSIKLFKPYLLDGEENGADGEEKVSDAASPERRRDDVSFGKCRRDSALADEDKDSTRESPAISERFLATSPAATGAGESGGKSHYPIIWSNNSSSAYYEQFYEFSPPTVTPATVASHHPLMVPAFLQPQPQQQGSVPSVVGVTTGGRGWSSPQASPVSGYDSSTSISSVCSSGPEDEHSGQPEQLKQQAIDSFYHDVACRGDYRAVATKYNINRKYVEKWLQQKDDAEQQHHHASSTSSSSSPPSSALTLGGAPVHAPLIVG